MERHDPLTAVEIMRRRFCSVCGSKKEKLCKEEEGRCEIGIVLRYVEEKEQKNE